MSGAGLAFATLSRDDGAEPVEQPEAGEGCFDEPPRRRGCDRAGQEAGTRRLDELAAAGLEGDRLDPLDEGVDHGLAVEGQIRGEAVGLAHDPQGVRETSADAPARELVGPLAAARADERALHLEPHGLGVDHQAIEIEEESGARDHGLRA